MGYTFKFFIQLLLLLNVNKLNAQNCPEKCECFNTTIECSDQGLMNFPDDFPQDATEIIISDNRISKLSNDAIVHFKSLEALIIDSNKLISLTLKIPPNLLKLSASMNYLTSLKLKPASENETINLQYIKLDLNMLREFPNLPKSLIVLSIMGNQIKYLAENAFTGYTELEELYINLNQIEQFQNDTFDNLTKLSVLDIRSNMHKELIYHWFDNKPHLKVVLLKTIYLNCDCELIKVHYALEKMSLERDDFDEIHCYTPPEYQNLLVSEMIEMDEYQDCVPEVVEQRRQKKIGLILGLFVLFALMAVGVAYLTFQWFKKQKKKQGESEYANINIQN